MWLSTAVDHADGFALAALDGPGLHQLDLAVDPQRLPHPLSHLVLQGLQVMGIHRHKEAVGRFHPNFQRIQFVPAPADHNLIVRFDLVKFEQDPLDSLFPALEKHGASIVIGGPFNSGVLVGRDTWNYVRAPEKVMERVKAIATVCDAHNVPLAAAALQFPLAHPVVASTIPGPRSAEELNQIIDWMQTPIPTSLWSDLRNEKLIAENAPVPG